MMSANRGFEAMIPNTKEEKKESIYGHTIKFSLFNREFNLSFNVSKRSEE